MNINASDRLAKAQSHLDRAYANEDAGELEQARQECDAAIVLDPSLAEALNLRGVVLEGLGHEIEAVAAYEDAVRVAPWFDEARENLAELRLEIGVRNRLVTISTFNYLAEAYVCKQKLETAGIWSFIADEHIVATNWLWSNLVGRAKLQVRALDAKRALEILNEPYDPTLGRSGPQCPRCTSFNARYEKYAWRLLFLSWLLLPCPLPFLKKKWKCKECGHEWEMES